MKTPSTTRQHIPSCLDFSSAHLQGGLLHAIVINMGLKFSTPINGLYKNGSPGLFHPHLVVGAHLVCDQQVLLVLARVPGEIKP